MSPLQPFDVAALFILLAQLLMAFLVPAVYLLIARNVWTRGHEDLSWGLIAAAILRLFGSVPNLLINPVFAAMLGFGSGLSAQSYAQIAGLFGIVNWLSTITLLIVVFVMSRRIMTKSS